MDEKTQKRWKKYKEKRSNAYMVMAYCLIFVGLGGLLCISAMSEKAMYSVLKDDEYLTDDGLPYRDMANATYTYPASEIDKFAEPSTYLAVMGGVIMAAAMVIALVVAWIGPDRREVHSMLCKQWQNETYAGNKLEYCPECGLELKKLEKE